MKNKIYIFILVALICFFPIKIFGFFATPDSHIRSMPFGVNNVKTNISGSPILLELVQSPEVKQINNVDLLQPASLNIGENWLSNLTWLTFLSAVMIVIIIFLLLKFKKML